MQSTFAVPPYNMSFGHKLIKKTDDFRALRSIRSPQNDFNLCKFPEKISGVGLTNDENKSENGKNLLKRCLNWWEILHGWCQSCVSNTPAFERDKDELRYTGPRVHEFVPNIFVSNL